MSDKYWDAAFNRQTVRIAELEKEGSRLLFLFAEETRCKEVFKQRALKAEATLAKLAKSGTGYSQQTVDVPTIVDFTNRRLRKTPVVYTVEFRHDSKGFSFFVNDVQDTPADRLAVASDFEAAAASLREG